MNEFSYQRKIRFADTDAAGVVYFTNLLSICHEAYEEYLANININLNNFFQDSLTAIPIIHAEIDFLKPLFCGDIILVKIYPKLVDEKIFTMEYQIFNDTQKVAMALTKHIAINPQTREVTVIPETIKKYFS